MSQIQPSGIDNLIREHPELQAKWDKLVAEELSGEITDDVIELAKAFPRYVFEDEPHGHRAMKSNCRVLNTFGQARAGTVLYTIRDTNACLVQVEEQQLVVHESGAGW